MKGKPDYPATRNFFNKTILPIEINFGLVFVFVSPTVMAIQRRTGLNQISKILRPTSTRKWMLGWRSIRFENTISLHIFIVCWLLFWSLLHVVFGLFLFYLKIYTKITPTTPTNNSTLATAQQLAGNLHTRKDFFDLFREKDTRFVKKSADQYMLGTGLALVLLFGVISANAIPIIRKKFFELFYITHHLFILAIVAFIFHSKGFKKSWAVPIAIYFVDKIYQNLVKRRIKKNTIMARKWTNTIMELRIPIEKKDLKKYCFAQDIFGKYIHIGCTSLSLVQWHPFDVASTIDDGYISVFVAANNGWTQKISKRIFGNKHSSEKPSLTYLQNHDEFGNNTVIGNSQTSNSNMSSENGIKTVDSQVSGFTELSDIQVEYATNSEVARKNGQSAFVTYNNSDIVITGLHDSIPKYVIENEVAVLVCGGTGIAPMLSIIKYFIRNIGDKKKIEHLKHIYLVWSTKEYFALGLLEELLSEVISRDLHSLVKVFIHYTGDYSLSTAQLNPQNVYKRLPNISSQFIRIIPGRQDIYSLLEAATTENPGSTFGLTAVGPKTLVRNARRTTNAWNRTSPFMLKVNFYEEGY